MLYAPGHLHPEVLNELAFMSLCPKADDVWLKAMSLMANVACKKVTSDTFPIIGIRIPNNRTLASENFDRDGNDPISGLRAPTTSHQLSVTRTGGTRNWCSVGGRANLSAAIRRNPISSRRCLTTRQVLHAGRWYS